MLNDLKVLELASVLAGPSVGQFFAELGAEVIKVENILTGGDVTRSWKIPEEKTDDRSSYFCSANWGKKSIALDLLHAEGREIVHRLAKRADIVVTSYKFGDAEKLGVDYKTLSALNSNLIYGQITGFGASNARVGYDAVVQAEAGFMFMNGEPGGPSLKMPVALIDILAAHHLKEAILLALLQKNKTGKGAFVEVSLLQAAVMSLANQASNWLVAGVIPQKQGSRHPNIAPYGDIFKTSDDHEILLAIGNDRQFDSLCKILEIQDELSDYSTNELRLKHRSQLNYLLSKKISTHFLSPLSGSFSRANIPYGIIKDLRQVFETPEAQSLLLFGDDRTGIRTSVNSQSDSPLPHILPPPRLGEHSHEILFQTLEMTNDVIEKLIEHGVVGSSSPKKGRF